MNKKQTPTGPFLLFVNPNGYFEKLEENIGKKGLFGMSLARTEEDALKVIGRETFNVVIADWDRLADDGFELLDAIKTYHRNTRILIINADDHCTGDLFLQGIAEIMPRPVEWGALVARVNSLLREQRRSKRFPCRPVSCRIRNSDKEILGCGNLMNISVDGALIGTTYPIPENINVEIEIFMPGTRSQSQFVTGWVMRRHPDDQWGKHKLGIYFDDDRSLEILYELEGCLEY